MNEVNEASPAAKAATLSDLLATITHDEAKAAVRFCDTCDDGEGYDVPKSMMKRLTGLKLVEYKGRGYYQQTELLLDSREALERMVANVGAKGQTQAAHIMRSMRRLGLSSREAATLSDLLG